MREEKKDSYYHHHHHSTTEHHHQQLHYGTFQGVPHHPPQSAISFPQLAPPSGTTAHPPHYYAHGYQAIPTEGTPGRQSRLPCCGCGIGLWLFIIGFLLAAIPWYVAAFVRLCGKIDPPEKFLY